ncbi:MAG: hypothetical protein WDW38_002174 [Sanguina aurantia]
MERHLNQLKRPVRKLWDWVWGQRLWERPPSASAAPFPFPTSAVTAFTAHSSLTPSQPTLTTAPTSLSTQPPTPEPPPASIAASALASWKPAAAGVLRPGFVGSASGATRGP